MRAWRISGEYLQSAFTVPLVRLICGLIASRRLILKLLDYGMSRVRHIFVADRSKYRTSSQTALAYAFFVPAIVPVEVN